MYGVPAPIADAAAGDGAGAAGWDAALATAADGSVAALGYPAALGSRSPDIAEQRAPGRPACRATGAESLVALIPERRLGRLLSWLGRLRGSPDTAVLAAAGALVALALAWMRFRWGGDEGVVLVVNLTGLAVGFSLAAMSWRAARSPGLRARCRLGWRLIALGCLAYWVGNVFWFRYEVVLGIDPFPSLADLGYLSFVPLVLAGLLCFVRPNASRAERAQLWLDVSVVCVGVGALLWYFLIAPISQARYNSGLELALAVAYPVGDAVLLLGVSALMLKHRRDRPVAPLVWLVAGLLLHLGADILFAYRSLQGPYASDGPADALYLLAYLAMMVAPYRERRIRARPAESADAAVGAGQGSLGIEVLPYLAVAAAYALLVYVELSQAYGHAGASAPAQWAGGHGGVVVAAALLTALAMMRQALWGREMARLRAVRAARESEARFAALARHSSDAIGLVGPDRRIRFVSPAVRQVLGLAPEALQDSALLDLVHPEDRERGAMFLDSIAAGGEVPAVVEWRLRHADGSWRDIETLGTRLEDGTACGDLVLNSRDVTERRRLEERLRALAFQDPLTGLANRARFQDRVARALTRAACARDKVTLLYLDLDDFKSVNDTLGHAAGDALLKTVAERLRQCARAADTVARLGGDELAILLEGPMPIDSAIALAERIAVRLAEPMAIEGRELRVSTSIGIAQGDPADGADALLRQADLAMYAVKVRGKRGYAVFAPTMQTAPSPPEDPPAGPGAALGQIPRGRLARELAGPRTGGDRCPAPREHPFGHDRAPPGSAAAAPP